MNAVISLLNPVWYFSDTAVIRAFSKTDGSQAIPGDAETAKHT
jgi:hypothetical protein